MRMSRVTDGPSFQLFKRPAEVIEHSPIEEFDLAFCSHDCSEAWNVIDDQTKTLYTLAHTLYRFSGLITTAEFLSTGSRSLSSGLRNSLREET
jgi:hypothetical protein